MIEIPQNIMDVLEKYFNAGYGMVPRVEGSRSVTPVIVGHRGVCGHPTVKENTLEAFDIAVNLGGGIELDMQLSKDHILVVSHDSNLLRIHGVDAEIADLSFAELKERTPQVPSLQEVFAKYGTRCPQYFLESKVYEPQESSVRLMAELRNLVKSLGLMKHVTLLSLDARPLDVAREVFPELSKAYVFGVDPKDAVDYALAHQDTGVAGWYFSFPRKIRKFLAERGLHEGVGHIDYKNTMKACSNQGYRFQFTNRIDKVASALPPKPSKKLLTFRPLRRASGVKPLVEPHEVK